MSVIGNLKIDTKASDWCSFWPDHWNSYDYSACCYKHDQDYADPSVSRWDADVALFKCVRKEFCTVWACIMFVGVRTFGWMFKSYVPQTE